MAIVSVDHDALKAWAASEGMKVFPSLVSQPSKRDFCPPLVTFVNRLSVYMKSHFGT